MELQTVAVSLLVLACLTVGVLSQASQPQCQLQGLPTFTDQGGGREPRLDNGVQVIVPLYNFSCAARVIQWGACVEPPRERYYIQFQVWRVQSGSSTQYSLVGRNSLTLSRSCVLVEVAEEDQITTQAGDVVGFFSRLVEEEGDDDAGGVELSRQFGTEMWRASADDFSISTCTPNSCTVTLSQGGEGDHVLSERINHIAPVITAMVQEVPTSPLLTPSDADDMFNGTNPGAMENSTSTSPEADQNLTTTIIGIVVGVLSLIILLVLVAVVAILLRRSRSRTMPIMELSNPTYSYEDSSTSVSQTMANKPSLTGIYALAGSDYSYQAIVESSEHATLSIEPTSTVNEGLAYLNEAAFAEINSGPHDSETQYATPSFRLPDRYDFSGVWVPTEEQRMAMGSGYEDLKTHQYSEQKFFVEQQTYWSPASTTSDLYAQLAAKKYREIARQQIILMEELGSGQFGQVCKGLVGGSMEVAVKTLKPGSGESEKVKFLREVAIMGQFSHPNIVKLYGVVTIGEPTMMILELLPHGDLRSYIRDLDFDECLDRYKLQVQFLKFLRQIAAGMAFLSRKSFVHRDLAARNILLDQQLVCKIGDFGMARDLIDDTYYTCQGGQIPVRWTAPEALLFKKYSIASDVWSYGMVAFEIWSLGRKPFYDMANEDIIDLVDTGYCQPPPPGCPRAVYKLMVDCWNPAHHERLTFLDVSDYLRLPDEHLLAWREEDSASSQKGQELGASITESSNFYLDLQYKYKEQRIV